MQSRRSGAREHKPSSRPASKWKTPVLIGVLAACTAFLACAVGLLGDVPGPPLVPSPSPEGLRPATPRSALVGADVSDRTPIAEPTDSPPTSIAPAARSRPKTLVHGSLTSSSGTALGAPGLARVSLVDGAGVRRSSDVELGAYAFHALEFGTYWMTARADGHRTLEQTLELNAADPLLRWDIVLQEAPALRIRVLTPDGRNLTDVLAQTGAPLGARLLVPIVTREPPQARLHGADREADGLPAAGQFHSRGPRLNGLSPDCMGVLVFDCDLPAYVSLVIHETIVETRRVDAGEEELTFTMSPDEMLAKLAGLRVRVIDAETGLAVARARVTLRGGTYADQGVATDAWGEAAIAGREPGRFELRVVAEGYQRLIRRIDAQPGETIELGTVALEREVGIEGCVLDSEDRPLALSFSVGTLDPVDRSIQWSRDPHFKSNGNGSFEVRGLRRGEHVIRVGENDALEAKEWQGHSWVSDNVVVDTHLGSLSGVVLRVRPASRLVLRAPGLAAGTRVRVLDEDGLELIASRPVGSHPISLRLPAGACQVVLLDRTGAVLSEHRPTLGALSFALDLTNP
jgi:hypothetical protein